MTFRNESGEYIHCNIDLNYSFYVEYSLNANVIERPRYEFKLSDRHRKDKMVFTELIPLNTERSGFKPLVVLRSTNKLYALEYCKEEKSWNFVNDAFREHILSQLGIEE
jgi:hypothetical protein